MTFNRFDDTSAIYVKAQIIKFKDTLINKNLYVYDYMDSNTTDVTLNLPETYDDNNSFIIPPVFNSVCLTYSTNRGFYKSFSMLELTNSGTQINISRGVDGSATHPAFNLIEFNPPNEYYFEGTVKEKDSYVDRRVALYRRSTNELIDKTVSSGTSGYRLESPYSDEHYIVCLDDDDLPDYNALIIDRAVGDLITSS